MTHVRIRKQTLPLNNNFLSIWFFLKKILITKDFFFNFKELKMLQVRNVFFIYIKNNNLSVYESFMHLSHKKKIYIYNKKKRFEKTHD